MIQQKKNDYGQIVGNIRSHAGLFDVGNDIGEGEMKKNPIKIEVVFY